MYFWWVTRQPLGKPVVPDVIMIRNTSSAWTATSGARVGALAISDS